jgi:hypothetical protein
MITSGNNTCHRKDCRYLKSQKQPKIIAILPENLRTYRKCSYCQPPVIKPTMKIVNVAL